MIRSRGTPIDDIFPAKPINAATERDSRSFLTLLNERYCGAHGDELPAARMHSDELAAKMQRVVPAVTDLGGPSSI
jgi:hypothetical protein